MLALNGLSTVDYATLSVICRNKTVHPTHLVSNCEARNNTKTKVLLVSLVSPKSQYWSQTDVTLSRFMRNENVAFVSIMYRALKHVCFCIMAGNFKCPVLYLSIKVLVLEPRTFCFDGLHYSDFYNVAVKSFL